jgi:hypothetical protein
MNYTAKIYGTLRGTIWMPATTCEKPVEYTLESDDTLRDAVLRITNDGDFRACDLCADSFLRIKMHKGTHTITRDFDLSLFPSVADCMLEAYPEFE